MQERLAILRAGNPSRALGLVPEILEVHPFNAPYFGITNINRYQTKNASFVVNVYHDPWMDLGRPETCS